VLQLVRAGSRLGSIAAGSAVGPAMSIAAPVTRQLYGAAADGPAVDGAFVAFGQDSALPQPDVRSWPA
jgi:hypothetical protein